MAVAEHAVSCDSHHFDGRGYGFAVSTDSDGVPYATARPQLCAPKGAATKTTRCWLRGRLPHEDADPGLQLVPLSAPTLDTTAEQLTLSYPSRATRPLT